MKTTQPISQIDFSVENIGKRQEETKRRIKWIYAVGTSDRHEIVFTWSTVSGKQHVEVNGTTMLSQQWQRTIFNEQLLTTSGGQPIQLRLVCTRAPPNGAHPNFRQYELLINDRPFFTYPRLDGKGFAVEADTPERPMSILGLLYPGKYYQGGSTNKQPKSPASSSEIEQETTMVMSDDDEDLPDIPKITVVTSRDENESSFDAPFDEHE